MIKNERQYRITRSEAEKFAEALTEVKASAEDDRTTNPMLIKLRINAMESQLETLHRELREYDDLREGRTPCPGLLHIFELGRDLIRARIASGLTQRELAERLRIAEQQIQRYEKDEYQTANFAKMMEIADVLRDIENPVGTEAASR